ncbi:MAG: UDP-2,3-diacylglucosamine pyrophosphatase [Robiginitomaculum sp.]|nr:MAG: UDP-2,3-diacylglucosamine pyrophosphatase [Robiginitomaculum sp.]
MGVVAGDGDLPLILANKARADGAEVYIAALKGFANQDWHGFETQTFAVEDMAAMCVWFHDVGADAVTFAGSVKRPDFDYFQPDNLAVSAQDALHGAAQQGDDALLRAVISIFEQAGFSVIGLDDIAPDYLVKTGLWGRKSAYGGTEADCLRASEIARTIGAMDIGQGAVVAKGVVLAVEAQEGTAAMLSRCAALPAALRGTQKNRCGVFAKWAKPEQDRRIDLPVIGMATIKAVAEAGLSGLVLEAGGVILLNPEAIYETAERLGLFILGVQAEA